MFVLECLIPSLLDIAIIGSTDDASLYKHFIAEKLFFIYFFLLFLLLIQEMKKQCDEKRFKPIYLVIYFFYLLK